MLWSPHLRQFVPLEVAVGTLLASPGPIPTCLPALAFCDALGGGDSTCGQTATSQHLMEVAALKVRPVAVFTRGQLLFQTSDGQGAVHAPGLAVRVLPLGRRGVLSAHRVAPVCQTTVELSDGGADHPKAPPAGGQVEHELLPLLVLVHRPVRVQARQPVVAQSVTLVLRGLC